LSEKDHSDSFANVRKKQPVFLRMQRNNVLDFDQKTPDARNPAEEGGCMPFGPGDKSVLWNSS
jgi:hypothetical protein